jgi:hypothetical protein
VPGEYLAEATERPKMLPEIWREVFYAEIDRREGNAQTQGLVKREPKANDKGPNKPPF